MSLASYGWIGCIHCEKLWCDFVERTSSLIAPVQPVLHRVPWNNETLLNATKYNAMHQNMSLGSNAVDRVRSLRKIPMRLRGKNFCINCTSSTCFAPSFVQQRNNPKCAQTLRNIAIHEFRVQWNGSGAFVAKYTKTLRDAHKHEFRV